MNFGINAGVVTVSYIIATVLFILALGGLANPETARRGNWYGITGMAIALVATVLGVVTQHYALLFGALLVGGSIGLLAARRVQMTQMPELVAILHSLVGLAAVLIGILLVTSMTFERLILFEGFSMSFHISWEMTYDSCINDFYISYLL